MILQTSFLIPLRYMFSKATEYAMRACIFIAQKTDEYTRVSLTDISIAIDSPEPFTAKILQKLSHNETVISSRRGRDGGFFMTTDQKKLPIRKIIAVMDDDACFEACVLGLTRCVDTKPCPLHDAYAPIKKQLSDMFRTHSIGQLSEEMLSGRFFISSKARNN